MTYIQKFCKINDIKPADLARKLDTSHHNLRNWGENGKYKTILTLALNELARKDGLESL